MVKITAKEIIEAIKGSAGIVSTIAKNLGIDWHTTEKYINLFPTAKKAYQDEVEKILDMSEGVILDSISSKDTASAKWYLTKKGKQRGYGDEAEINLKGFESFAELIKEITKKK